MQLIKLKSTRQSVNKSKEILQWNVFTVNIRAVEPLTFVDHVHGDSVNAVFDKGWFSIQNFYCGHLACLWVHGHPYTYAGVLTGVNIWGWKNDYDNGDDGKS